MGSLFSGGTPPNALSQANSPYGAGGALQEENTTAQVQAYDSQGLIAETEGVRDAIQQANQGHQYRENQAIAADSSGVLLSGSPLLNLEYTRQQSQQEADAILTSAQANASKLYQSGQNVSNQGRAYLLGEQDSVITENAQQRINRIASNAQIAGSVFGDVLGLGTSAAGMAAGTAVGTAIKNSF
jgi:hypothetical protein